MAHWLPLAFALVAVFAIAAYVCLDGMDLGVGILYLFAPRDADRQLMMESIEPIWDGNETWQWFSLSGSPTHWLSSFRRFTFRLC
jgi:cytochrome d ubiquinol oxidase subunit II